MRTDLDTLLIALYVLVDDHVIAPQDRRPGRPKQLSDAELVCLAVAQVLLGARSEHHWLRLCYGRLGHLFPYRPKQPGYHKRLKAAAPLLCKTMLHLARLCPSWADRHGGRTPSGVIARVAQRLLALAAVIWHNWKIDAPVKGSLIAYDHRPHKESLI